MRWSLLRSSPAAKWTWSVQSFANILKSTLRDACAAVGCFELATKYFAVFSIFVKRSNSAKVWTGTTGNAVFWRKESNIYGDTGAVDNHVSTSCNEIWPVFVRELFEGWKPSCWTMLNGTGIIPNDSVVAIHVGRIFGMGKDGWTPALAAFSTISSLSQVSKCPECRFPVLLKCPICETMLKTI